MEKLLREESEVEINRIKTNAMRSSTNCGRNSLILKLGMTAYRRRMNWITYRKSDEVKKNDINRRITKSKRTSY